MKKYLLSIIVGFIVSVSSIVNGAGFDAVGGFDTVRIRSIGDVFNFNISSFSSGNLLYYDGTNVVNTSILSIDSNGALTLTPTAGQNLNINLSGAGDLAVNTNQLYVDTSTGFVGIGDSAPSHTFSLASTAYTQVLRTYNTT